MLGANPLKRLAKAALASGVLPQGLWERLHRLALRGMNVGGGSTVADSGERWVMRWLRDRTAGRTPTVFDVGANVGDYALELNEILQGRADIYCFEPATKTFAELSSRLKEVPTCRLVQVGLSDKKETLTLHFNVAADSGIASVYDRDLVHHGLSLPNTEEIALTTLDAFCAEHGVRHIDFLKMDVEGHELSVLRGASEMISSGAIDAIQFEFGGTNIDSRTYFRDFFNLLDPGYRMHRVLPRGMRAIPRYRETDELFTTTNFLAVSRRTGGQSA
jgi:FkbM family methyltransferase